MFNQGIYSKSSGGGGTGQGITGVVANYSALPAAAAAADEFYFVESPQGTAWLPGSLGGTYYPAGLYYSNGVTWFYAESPYQATLATVNTGTNTDQFVSPYTLANATTVERPLTFSTGLTRTVNTVTANISTGISGGQTIYGGTGASEKLTISSTTNATKGTIQIGTTDLVNIGNAVTTSQRILRVGQDTSYVDIGSLVGAGTIAALYMNKATPSATNYTLHVTSSDTVALNGAFLTFKTSNTNKLTIDASTFIFTPGSASNLALKAFSFTLGANVNQTASTEVSGVYFDLRSRQWATGAITTQREFLLLAPTYSFVAASTITSAATFAITGSPIAGTNATITNTYSLWIQGGISRFDGSISHNDAVDLIFGTTTGTKIGTATTQKIGFWNTTPIVQPTTAIAASTFAANTSGIVDDTATFDGYTIGQITKALRNLGILA